MTSAARNPEIPPAPFVKGGDDLLLKPLFAFLPSASTFPFPPLKKGCQGGFASGFTLVEVIVTILMAAIMGAFFIQFMGTAMSRSTRAIEYVRDEASAEAVMEEIVAEYVAEVNKSDPMNALNRVYTKSHGTRVTKDYVQFNPSGVAEVLVPPNTSRTLRVKVQAQANSGSFLTTLLTESRQAGPPASPPVAY